MVEQCSNEVTINLDTFSRRLQLLYSRLWGCADFLSIATPPLSDDLHYLKSSTLNLWLLGYEFPETIMVFGSKQIHFLCTKRKASILEIVKNSAKEAVGVEVITHVKQKGDDGTTQMDAVLNAMRSQRRLDGSSPRVGYIVKEVPEGMLLEKWADKLKNSGLPLWDVTYGFSDLFAVKEEDEITFIKKAAYLSASVMKFFVVPKLEDVIDEGKKVTHSSLAYDTETAILDPAKIKVKLRAENVDICYPPIFQSGGNFDLRPSASNNDDHLFCDSTSVIICALGSRYNLYCSNVARTFLIDANTMQIKAYEVLLKAQEAAIAALLPGNQASEVYDAALAVVKREAPELLPNLTKSAGTGIGLEFRESGLILNSRNDRVIKAGMVFNVSLGFENLQTDSENPKGRNFALWLADTVTVTNGGHEVLTKMSSKSVEDVCFFYDEIEEEEEEEPWVEVESNEEMSKEELRWQHQAEETARRLAAGGDSVAGNATTGWWGLSYFKNNVYRLGGFLG